MNTSQRVVTPCGWGVKAAMVRTWVAGETLWSPCYTRAVSERFRGLIIIKCYINSSAYFLLTRQQRTIEVNRRSASIGAAKKKNKMELAWTLIEKKQWQSWIELLYRAWVKTSQAIPICCYPNFVIGFARMHWHWRQVGLIHSVSNSSPLNREITEML